VDFFKTAEVKGLKKRVSPWDWIEEEKKKNKFLHNRSTPWPPSMDETLPRAQARTSLV